MAFRATYFVRIAGIDQRVQLATSEHNQEDAWFAMQEAEQKAAEIQAAIKQTEMAKQVVPGSFEICLTAIDLQLLLFPGLGPIKTQEVKIDTESPEYWLNPDAPTLRDLFGGGH